MGELYSIGHSKHEFNKFLKMLKDNNIDYLLDVRSSPFSKYAETYNKDNLKDLLDQNGIVYWHMGGYFGARPEEKELYTQENYLDFEKVRAGKKFQDGVKSVLTGLNEGKNIVLMCTERDPMDCHRAIMVSKGFLDAGVNVKHILPDGSIETQKELENRMLEKYFPYGGQLSFIESETTEQERLEMCYRKRNKEIGYTIAEGEQ